MHILVTNDDGINSPGLLVLSQAMRNLGEVSILAPNRNWSGGGHVKTLDRPLRVSETKLADGSVAYTSDGAPSDCVALALLGYVPGKVDIVVSGINPVANVGQDITYSGTVTAAMEAVIWGIPGIAFSINCEGDKPGEAEYQSAAMITEIITEFVLGSTLPNNVLLNVNIPCGDIKGIKTTRQGMRVYRDRLDQRIDPRGVPYYWIGGESPTGVPEEGTDIGALAKGYVSITPLQLDLTAYQTMDQINIMLGDHNFPIHELEYRSNGRS